MMSKEKLDARVEADLDQTELYYRMNEEMFVNSWDDLRPRVIKRLNRLYGVTSNNDSSLEEN